MDSRVKLLSWKIWYADGSTASSDTSLWNSAPSTGVQVVSFVVQKPARVRRYNYRGKDFFGFNGEMVYKSNRRADLTKLGCNVKEGSFISTESFQTMLTTAKTDTSMEDRLDLPR